MIIKELIKNRKVRCAEMTKNGSVNVSTVYYGCTNTITSANLHNNKLCANYFEHNDIFIYYHIVHRVHDTLH